MSGFVLAAAPSPEVSDEAARLVAQPLAGFEDTCEEQGTARVRHVRFATLDASGRREAELELRTTSGESGDVLDYLVGGAVVFTHRSGEEPEVIEAGHVLLANDAQATKIMAAFAAAPPRIFANDVDAPGQACGPFRGKPEQLAKCGAIAALGVGGGPVVAFFSGCAAVLCYYAVEKACEGNPDSCQPGWTEG